MEEVNEQFFSYTARTMYIWWNDDDDEFGIYSGNSLKQHSVGGHVAPFYK